MLTTHPHIVLRSRMSRRLCFLHLNACMASSGTAFFFTSVMYNVYLFPLYLVRFSVSEYLIDMLLVSYEQDQSSEVFVLFLYLLRQIHQLSVELHSCFVLLALFLNCYAIKRYCHTLCNRMHETQM
jgi:hypothetical protein